MSDEKVEHLNGAEGKEFDTFKAHVEETTKYLQDKAIDEKEQIVESDIVEIDGSHVVSLDSHSPLSVSETVHSIESSYSAISDEEAFRHGAAFSKPRATFRESKLIDPDVVKIHNLLMNPNEELFFTPESDSDSDQQLDGEELSQQRKISDQIAGAEENASDHHHLSSISKANTNSNKRKLKKEMSERSQNFAINEGLPRFNWTAFIREWIYNLLNIWGLPLVLYFENKSGAMSRFYWPPTWGFFGCIGFVLATSFFYINIAYAIVRPDKESGNTDCYTMLMLVFNVMYVLRVSVIAIKWGYMPESLFKMMRKKPLTKQQYSLIHFLTGWVNHSNQHGLAREIGQCCARLEIPVLFAHHIIHHAVTISVSDYDFTQIDINKMQFRFRDDHGQNSKTKLSIAAAECGTFTTYGNLLIPYLVFCASRHVSIRGRYAKFAAVIGTPLMVGFYVFGRQIERYDSWEEWINSVGPQTGKVINYCIWYFLVWFNTSINLMTVVRFSSVISLDFRRRHALIRFCTRLIELKKNAFSGNVDFPDHKEHLFPPKACASVAQERRWAVILKDARIETLDLSHYPTMYNWSLLRAFFLDFGLRFLKREEALLGLFVLFTLIVVVVYISLIYTGEMEINLFDAVFVCCSALAVLIPAFRAIRYATRINHKIQYQKTILADKRLRLENARGRVNKEFISRNRAATVELNDEETRQKIEETETCLTYGSGMLLAIVRLLEADKFRIKMLNYPIDTTVTGIIAFVVAAVGYTMARIFLANQD